MSIFSVQLDMLLILYATVRSLAEHFTDGKLTAAFLETAPVEEVSKALIDIRGIGQVSKAEAQRQPELTLGRFSGQSTCF